MNKERIKKIIKNIYPYLLVIIAVILIRSFIITPALVDGSSMNPTLKDNDMLLLNKINYRLNGVKRFDVVVLNYNGEKLVKRIIGLPGEHVEYKNNMLYVDGFLVEEDFNHKTISDFKLEQIGYLTIPGDKYFVVGDNRGNSKDSRIIGLIDKKDILGKSSFRLFPSIGKIK